MAVGIGDLFKAPVNNTGLDPLVGFDAEVWVTDTYSGKIASVGKFQSCTLSIRNATETYLELGQRIPIYLDGEIQIAWVLEQGLIDMDFLARYFGVRDIARDQYITRGPRFTISVDMNAAELTSPNPTNRNDNNFGSRNYYTPYDKTSYAFDSPTSRQNYGRYELMRCKLDSLSLGIMPGRRVIAQRWEGVAEGIRYINETVQSNNRTAARQGTTSGLNTSLNSSIVQDANAQRTDVTGKSSTTA